MEEQIIRIIQNLHNLKVINTYVREVKTCQGKRNLMKQKKMDSLSPLAPVASHIKKKVKGREVLRDSVVGSTLDL